MNSILIAGTIIVTLALASYSIGVITKLRKKHITPTVLRFVTIGIALDITATACMIIGSPNSPFTLHGFIGYSALAVMLIDVFWIWKRHAIAPGEKITKALHYYSLSAYSWWVVAFITGGMLAMAN